MRCVSVLQSPLLRCRQLHAYWFSYLLSQGIITAHLEDPSVLTGLGLPPGCGRLAPELTQGCFPPPPPPQDGALEGNSELFSFGDSQVGVGRGRLGHLSSIDIAEIPALGSHITQISNYEHHSIVFPLASRCWKLEDTFEISAALLLSRFQLALTRYKILAVFMSKRLLKYPIIWRHVIYISTLGSSL